MNKLNLDQLKAQLALMGVNTDCIKSQRDALEILINNLNRALLKEREDAFEELHQRPTNVNLTLAEVALLSVILRRIGGPSSGCGDDDRVTSFRETASRLAEKIYKEVPRARAYLHSNDFLNTELEKNNSSLIANNIYFREVSKSWLVEKITSIVTDSPANKDRERIV